MEAVIKENLGLKPTWTAPHIGADGKKTWERLPPRRGRRRNEGCPGQPADISKPSQRLARIRGEDLPPLPLLRRFQSEYLTELKEERSPA